MNILVPLGALLFLSVVYAAVRLEQSRKSGRTQILAFIIIPLVLVILSLIITDGRLSKARIFTNQKFIVLRPG